jgi:glutamine amidotransferase
VCRLIGFASLTSESIGDVIGERQTDVFQDMSRLHRDGWGTMWLEEEASDSGAPAVAAVRSVNTGFRDVDLRSSLISRPSRARVAHLRLASKGMPVRHENTHPYVADNLGFAHNGGIIPTDDLARLVEPEFRGGVRGNTDSELYFALIRQNLRDGRSLRRATVDAVAAIRERYPLVSLNALLLGPDELIAVHASRHTPIPHEEFAQSGLAHTELPLEHTTDYYRMGCYRSPNGSIAFSSVGIDMAGWHELPQESVTSVDLHTLEVDVVALETAESLTA